MSHATVMSSLSLAIYTYVMFIMYVMTDSYDMSLYVMFTTYRLVSIYKLLFLLIVACFYYIRMPCQTTNFMNLSFYVITYSVVNIWEGRFDYKWTIFTPNRLHLGLYKIFYWS